MGKQFSSFAFYYRCFFAEFAGNLWQSWRAEIWPAAVLAVLVFIVSYQHDPNARMAFTYTVEGCGIYLALWGVYHLIRTPWKLNEHPPVFKVPEKAASPLPVDLRGEILELFLHAENDLLGLPSRTYILMKVQIVNRGAAEVTITRIGLQVRVGQFKVCAICSRKFQKPGRFVDEMTDTSIWSTKIRHLTRFLVLSPRKRYIGLEFRDPAG